MSAHMYAAGLCHVATGLASLERPTPEKIEQLASDLRRVALGASSMDRHDIDDAAREAEAVARLILRGTGDVQAAGAVALDRLARLLLDSLVKCALKPLPVNGQPLGLERKILVVDDSRVAAVALATALAAEEFLVRSVTSMEEALVELSSFAPSVLVSDIHMPNLDVALLSATFRELRQGRPAPVVLVSGTTGSELRDRLDQVKPDAFVPKSAGTDGVVRRVLELWRKVNACLANQG